MIGRDVVLARCRQGLAEGGLLVHGAAGIGRSTLLAALCATMEPGALVLTTSAAAPEQTLPYVGLMDLLANAYDEHAAALPDHLRAALGSALLRAPAPGRPVDQLAVRVAALELVRIASATRPVLLVIDDAQWLDRESADVLEFVVRRLRGTTVRVLVAERTDAGEQPAAVGLCPRPVTELAVEGLTEAEIGELLRDRLDVSLSGATLARVTSASGAAAGCPPHPPGGGDGVSTDQRPAAGRRPEHGGGSAACRSPRSSPLQPPPSCRAGVCRCQPGGASCGARRARRAGG